MILFWQFMADKLIEFEIIDGPIQKNDLLPHCIPPENSPYFSSSESQDQECITVGYAIIGPREAWTEYVMDYVARTNKLELGKDVKLLAQSSSSDTLYNMLKQQPNVTQIAVIFCTSEWPIGKNYFNVPCKFDELQE